MYSRGKRGNEKGVTIGLSERKGEGRKVPKIEHGIKEQNSKKKKKTSGFQKTYRKQKGKSTLKGDA